MKIFDGEGLMRITLNFGTFSSLSFCKVLDLNLVIAHLHSFQLTKIAFILN